MPLLFALAKSTECNMSMAQKLIQEGRKFFENKESRERPMGERTPMPSSSSRNSESPSFRDTTIDGNDNLTPIDLSYQKYSKTNLENDPKKHKKLSESVKSHKEKKNDIGHKPYEI